MWVVSEPRLVKDVGALDQSGDVVMSEQRGSRESPLLVRFLRPKKYVATPSITDSRFGFCLEPGLFKLQVVYTRETFKQVRHHPRGFIAIAQNIQQRIIRHETEPRENFLLHIQVFRD